MGIKQFFVDRFAAGRKLNEPKRDTIVYPQMTQVGYIAKGQAQYKQTPANLRYFSRTPHVRAAIKRIRDPIQNMDWEIAPMKGVKLNAEIKRQIEIATDCFSHPNNDDSWSSLIGQAVEDYLVCGAGAIEQQLGGDPIRPLWLWPVDAQSIQIFPCWAGGRNEARYLQRIGYTNIVTLDGKKLRNDELIYVKTNDSTQSPYGFGCVEVAYQTINRSLGVAQFAGDLASNTAPQFILQLLGADEAKLNTFRDYWQNQIEGQGKIPIVGGEKDINNINLREGSDKSLFLEYQEFLIRVIAVSFALSPMNLGIESDVNRSTAEVGEDRDWDNAIKPCAKTFSNYLTREALHQKLGFYSLEFKWVGLDREDEESTADIYQTYYKNNLITPNEQREKLGMPAADNQWADLTFADTQIAMMAARGTAVIDDSDLRIDQTKNNSGDAGKTSTNPKKKNTLQDK